jgi:hypothetical protein
MTLAGKALGKVDDDNTRLFFVGMSCENGFHDRVHTSTLYYTDFIKGNLNIWLAIAAQRSVCASLYKIEIFRYRRQKFRLIV